MQLNNGNRGRFDRAILVAALGVFVLLGLTGVGWIAAAPAMLIVMGPLVLAAILVSLILGLKVVPTATRAFLSAFLIAVFVAVDFTHSAGSWPHSWSTRSADPGQGILVCPVAGFQYWNVTAVAGRSEHLDSFQYLRAGDESLGNLQSDATSGSGQRFGDPCYCRGIWCLVGDDEVRSSGRLELALLGNRSHGCGVSRHVFVCAGHCSCIPGRGRGTATRRHRGTQQPRTDSRYWDHFRVVRNSAARQPRTDIVGGVRARHDDCGIGADGQPGGAVRIGDQRWGDVPCDRSARGFRCDFSRASGGLDRRCF